MLNKFRLAAAVALMSLGLGMGQAAADDLRIGVEGAYKPFSWKEPDGTLKGFDIEIAMALCEKMGKSCTLVEQAWDGIIPALVAKKYDAIIASMSITEERMKVVDFSKKYYNTPAKFVAKKGTDLKATPEGLAGKRIGVQRGTTHQCYLEKFHKNAEIVPYATQEDVFQDLVAGRIDVQLSDSIQSLEGFLSQDMGKDYAYLGENADDLECYGEGAGIAVRKGEDELREAFNKAIQEIRDDGTYQKINAKYFDFDIY